MANEKNKKNFFLEKQTGEIKANLIEWLDRFPFIIFSNKSRENENVFPIKKERKLQDIKWLEGLALSLSPSPLQSLLILSQIECPISVVFIDISIEKEMKRERN